MICVVINIDDVIYTMETTVLISNVHRGVKWCKLVVQFFMIKTRDVSKIWTENTIFVYLLWPVRCYSTQGHPPSTSSFRMVRQYFRLLRAFEKHARLVHHESLLNDCQLQKVVRSGFRSTIYPCSGHVSKDFSLHSDEPHMWRNSTPKKRIYFGDWEHHSLYHIEDITHKYHMLNSKSRLWMDSRYNINGVSGPWCD